MLDELSDLLDMAIYKEIAAQAFYIAGQGKTQDEGAKALMRELAEEEIKHSQRLKDLKEKGLRKQDIHLEPVPNLRLSEYLTGSDGLENAGLQDTLAFAIRREQQAIDFYSRLVGIMRDEEAKRLAESLAHEELEHKLRLELLYDDLFYGED